MTDMKRSTEQVMYVTPADYRLARCGAKTATTRVGDRRQMWPVGSEIEIVDNEDENNRLKARVVYNELMDLEQVTAAQARTVGCYGVEEHWHDFVSVYGTLCNGQTQLSLVGYFLLYRR